MLHESHLPGIKGAFSTLVAASCAVILIFLCPTVRADISTPDTPAGHALQAFLQAFNASDSDRIAAYISQFDPKNSVSRLTALSSQTGGFTVTSIAQSSPDKLAFFVHGRGDNVDSYGILQLSSVSPPLVKRLSIREIPPGESVDDVRLDATRRQTAIKAISRQLTDFYVYPEIAKKMVEALHNHHKRGDYNSIVDGDDFAEALTKDLRVINSDRHLSVAYDPFTSSKHADTTGPLPPDPAEDARFRAALEHQNCTFSKLEILNHNIGYMKFDSFPPPEFCGSTVVAAMNFLAHTDALIFDLRENHGGDPDMVDFAVSYLFRRPTHINDLTNRHDNEIHQFWTYPWVSGPRLIDQPVYVLTSHATFSGGEEFVFDLKTQKRATIVGETTGGGAHPVRSVPAGEHFSLRVPIGRPINPVTKGDWEGKGIEPDVQTNAADALTTAEKLAADRLATNDGHR